MSVPFIRTVADLRKIVTAWRQEKLSVAVVPTMGALHEGHLSLVRAALKRADRVIVTLFVNPKQFNSPADLAAYPSTERRTPKSSHRSALISSMCRAGRKSIPKSLRPPSLWPASAKGCAGPTGPVTSMAWPLSLPSWFVQTGADFAFFGEKDFQQLHVVRRMARDLDLPIEIIACPTVRESDGLALSSRNVRLSHEERRLAPKLAVILFAAGERLTAGEPVEKVLVGARQAILAAGFGEVDYLELRPEHDLSPLAVANRSARLLAAWLGKTRLIDNVGVRPREAGVTASAVVA